MKSNIKILGVWLATATLAATGFAATDNSTGTNAPAAAKPGVKLEDLLPDPVIAKGKGFELKRSELDDVLASLKASAIESGQAIPPTRLPQIEVQLLDNLIQTKLFLAQATDAQKARGKEEADRRWDSIKKKAPSEEALAHALKARGFTVEKLQANLKDEATAQQVMFDKVSVSDADVKKFYDDNPSKFEQREVAHGQHILMTIRDSSGMELSDEQKQAKLKQMEAILKRARDGEDFAKLAKQYSEDPNSKETGGDFKISRGQGVPPEFEAAAFSLKTNQISDVVTTAYGYHIIKLAEKVPAHRVELKEVSDDVKTYLAQQEAQKVLPKLYAQMKKDAGVEILDADLKTREEVAAKLAETAAADAADKPAKASQ